MTGERLRRWLADWIARELGLAGTGVDTARPVADLGLSSRQAVRLASDVQQLLGRDVSPALVYDYPTIDALADHLAGVEDAVVPVRSTDPREVREPIAIVGIGCRFPGSAPGPVAFFEFLTRGVDGVSEVPVGRWVADAGCGGSAADASSSPCALRGGFLDAIDEFDPEAFGIAPAEAAHMDPQQRLVLEAAWHAMDDACLSRVELKGSRTGVFVGISHSDYQDLGSRSGRVGPLTATGTSLSIAANRVSYVFDLMGASVAIDTACSSSLVAVHSACLSLLAGESTCAIAGGVNVVLTPDVSRAFTAAGLMAPDGRCKPFDDAANGYVRGEGVGLVVLKRLSDALRDGHEIYGLILGSAVNQDGRSSGLMAPRGVAQEHVILAACEAAGVAPSELDYVEAHGTGTALGDVIEATAIGRTVGAGRNGDAPCLIGSVKSNIGHLESAAGIAGLIKTVLSLRHGMLGPTLHFAKPNGAIDFRGLGLEVTTATRQWPARGPRRLAGVSSFGFGGTNAHVILSNYRAPEPASADRRVATPLLLTLSAQTPASLAALETAYAERLAALPSDEAAKLVAASVHRAEHRCRVACVGPTPEAIRDRLRNGLDAAGWIRSAAPPGSSPIGFVFHGQGFLRTGAGRQLFEADDVFRSALLRADDVLRKYTRTSILPVMWREEEQARLARTEHAQPALFALQIALAELLKSWGVVPAACVGHSVGEIAAAHAAGRLDLEEATRLVALRGNLMAPAFGLGRLAAVRASAEEVSSLIRGCARPVTIAAVNASRSTTISGSHEDVAAVLEAARALGIAAAPLQIEYAFHSPQMADAAAHLRDERFGEGTQGDGPAFYSTQTGRAHPDPLTAEYWARNVLEPVQFGRAVTSMLADGIRVFLVIGPDDALARDVASMAGDGAPVETLSILQRGRPEAVSVRECQARLYVNGGLPARGLTRGGVARTVEIPPYTWSRARHWLPATRQPRTRTGVLDQPIAVAPDGRQIVWTGAVDVGAMPSLRDHRIRGRPVFPASAYIELLLDALAEPGAGSASLQLASVEFIRPLSLTGDAPVPLQVVRRTSPAGESDITVYCAAGTDEGGWEAYARARIEACDAAPASAVAIEAIRVRASEQYSGALLYARLAARGLDYGPSYQRVRDVAACDGEAIGRLQLDDDTSHDGRTPSSLIDASLHVVAATLGAESLRAHAADPLVLPTSVERVCLRRRGVPAWSYCRLLERSAERVRADVLVLDAAGEVLLEMSGVILRAAVVQGHARELEAVAHDDWVYRVEWRAQSAQSPATGAPRDGVAFVLCDEGGVGEAIAARLEEQGLRCVRVHKGAALSCDGPDRYTAASASAADLAAILRESAGVRWTALYHCWSADSIALDDADAVSSGPLALLTLVRCLRSGTMFGSPRVIVVTRGAVPVEPGEIVNPTQALALGMVRAVVLEHPDIEFLCVDVDSHGDATSFSDAIVQEAARSERDDRVALRRGTRYVPRLLRHVPVPRRPYAADPAASYLVTGGTGALGLEFARALIERGARRLVLLSRSAPNVDAQRTLDRLAALRDGVEIVMARGDVADAEQVRTLVAREHERKPIKGIVHAAGVLDDGTCLELSAQRVENVMRPKVQGTIALHAAVADLPLDFFVLFSSAASVLGSPGQASYCAANAFLDAFAAYRSARGARTLSISWGAWADRGMAADSGEVSRLASSGLVATIPPGEGVDLGLRLFACDVPHVSVLPFDVPALLQFHPSNAGLAFFDDLVHDTRLGARAPGACERVGRRRPRDVEHVEPQTDVERLVASIWRSALGMPEVGVNDELFALGGDSVFAMQILGRIDKAYGVQLDPNAAFASFTIGRLAALVDEALLRRLATMNDEEAGVLLRAVEQHDTGEAAARELNS